MIFATVHRLLNKTVTPLGNLRENIVPNIVVRFVNIYDSEAVMQDSLAVLKKCRTLSTIIIHPKFRIGT